MTQKNIFYVLGLMLGDGGIYYYNRGKKGDSYEVQSTNDTSKDFVLRISRMLQAMGIETSIRRQMGKKSPYFTCRSQRKAIFELFKKMGVPVGSKSNTVRIPQYIFDMGIEEQVSVVRGIFDAEGGVYFLKEKKYPFVSMNAMSSGLIYDVQRVLKKVNIDPKISYHPYSKKTFIYISGRDKVTKFMDTIGFRHPEQIKKWNIISSHLL